LPDSVWVARNPAEFWTQIQGIAGALSFLIAIALLIIAVRGLGQLKIGLSQLEVSKTDVAQGKKDMLTRAERDSITSAIVRCDEFRREVIPLNGVILTAMYTLKIPVFVQDASEVQFDPDNKAEVRRAKEWLVKLPADLHNNAINLMNRLEVWSMFFTHRIADSATAFAPTATLYVGIVVQLYAILLVKRNDDKSGSFPNLVELYKVWTGQKGVAVPEALRQVKVLQQQTGPIGYVVDHPKARGTEV
jgi:hypothetical protein